MDGIYWTQAARERVYTRYRALLASSPVPLQELRIPTQMGDTCVFVCGSTQSPPVVLLHGGNANSAMWLRSLSAWSVCFRVYAVDTVGGPGFSEAKRLPFHADEHARWLSAEVPIYWQAGQHSKANKPQPRNSCNNRWPMNRIA